MADGSRIWRKADEDDGGGLPHVRSTEIDMGGQRIGEWTVVARVPSVGRQGARWLCRCSCGTERQITTARLRGEPPLRWCRACQLAALKASKTSARVNKPRLGRSAPRGMTIAIGRWGVRQMRAGAAEYPPEEIARYDRPVTRGDCLSGGINEMRPCPWVSCKHHLALGVEEHTGNIKINHPTIDIADMRTTCALDVADDGGTTLDGVGQLMNLTRERIRQIELTASQLLSESRLVRRIAGVE